MHFICFKKEDNIISKNDARKTVDNFCQWTTKQAYNRMINKGGYHFDVAVLLTRTGIGPAGEKKTFYFIWYMFLKSVVDLFSLFCLSELKLCQLTNTEESNKRMWDYLKLSLSEDRCENCNDPYDFPVTKRMWVYHPRRGYRRRNITRLIKVEN